MTLVFYPHEDDLSSSSLEEKLEVLMESAERYKAAVLDASKTNVTAEGGKQMIPKDIKIAYNWEEIARVLSEIRQLPESSQANKLTKADRLTKLAEIYEVLRGAKMPKLEAVRLALINEASQLKAGV